jgi:hypothetical protein
LDSILHSFGLRQPLVCSENTELCTIKIRCKSCSWYQVRGAALDPFPTFGPAQRLLQPPESAWTALQGKITTNNNAYTKHLSGAIFKNQPLLNRTFRRSSHSCFYCCSPQSRYSLPHGGRSRYAARLTRRGSAGFSNICRHSSSQA